MSQAELYQLEDLIGDSISPQQQVEGAASAMASAEMAKQQVDNMVRLSKRIAGDGAFSRQLKRALAKDVSVENWARLR